MADEATNVGTRAIASTEWPAWWALSSSPVELLQASPQRRRGVYPIAVVLFAVLAAVLAVLAFYEPRWGLTTALVGLAWVPWLGVAVTRAEGVSGVAADHWIRVMSRCLVPFVVVVPFLFFRADKVRGEALLDGGLFAFIVMGLLALLAGWGLTPMPREPVRRTRTGRRAAECSLALVLVLLASGGVKVWRDGHDSLPSKQPMGSDRSSLRSRAPRTGEDGVEARSRRFANRPVGPVLDAAVKRQWLAEDAGVSLDVRLPPRHAATAAYFDPRQLPKVASAAALVWAGAFAGYLVMRRRASTWRALVLVEARVTIGGRHTEEGWALPTDAAWPVGARVLVEAPRSVGVAYRANALPVSRAVLADASQWSDALTEAEGLVWRPLTLTLLGIGGLLAFDLSLIG